MRQHRYKYLLFGLGCCILLYIIMGLSRQPNTGQYQITLRQQQKKQLDTNLLLDWKPIDSIHNDSHLLSDGGNSSRDFEVEAANFSGNVVFSCARGRTVVRKTKQRASEIEFSASRHNIEQTESDIHRKQAFRDIFLKTVWTDDTDNPSGPGSSLHNTKAVRTTLNAVLDHVKRKLKKDTVRMLDVPCGDFSWMRHFLSERNDVIYTGIDIVPELVKSLQEKHSIEGKTRFVSGDVVTDPLDDAYDLVFSRHMTQHLSDYDTVKFLEKVSNSKSHYLLITTYTGGLNTDLMYGAKFRFRAQNLELPPYSLAPPICQGQDGDTDVTALWRMPLKQIPNCVVPQSNKHDRDVDGHRVYHCQ